MKHAIQSASRLADRQPADLGRREYLRPHHGALNIAQIFVLHAAVGAWLWWGRALLPYPAFLASAVFVCLLHQRQLSEGFHEATHWNLLPSRRANDWAANVLLGLLNGVTVAANRPGHFRHHAVTAYFTDDDPDTRSAAAGTRGELWRGLLLDVCGITAWRAFRHASRDEAATGMTRASRAAWFATLTLVHGAGFAATLAAGRPEIYPVWFGTLVTLYPVANRLRLYAQHAEISADGSPRLAGSRASRSFHAGLLERLLLHSAVIMYHHEHHRAPALPFRALRAIARPSADRNAYATGGLRFVIDVARRLGT